MTFIKNKSTRALIFIMIALVLTGLLIAKTYYGNINKSVDPRITNARSLYSKYDSYTMEGNFNKIFALLDSIENIYASSKHYKNSFEPGVIYNNKAAAFLTISMYADSIPIEFNPYSKLSKDSLLMLAETNVQKAISQYSSWNKQYKGKTKDELIELVKPDFYIGLENSDYEIKIKYLEARIEDIQKALAENDRRLSVCYTNLGVIFRQKEQYKEAVEYYDKALVLWDRNLNAENNRNLLLGYPVKKRNFIQRLFPPPKDQ